MAAPPLLPTQPATPHYQHSPDAELDYGWGFSDLIVATDSIVSAEFELEMNKPGGEPVTGATLTPGDIVNTPASGDNAQVNIVYGWLAIQDLALVGKRLSATCRYTTAQGRVDERTLWFTIKDW